MRTDALASNVSHIPHIATTGTMQHRLDWAQSGHSLFVRKALGALGGVAGAVSEGWRGPGVWRAGARLTQGARMGVKNDTAIMPEWKKSPGWRGCGARNRVESRKGEYFLRLLDAQTVAPGGKSRKQGAISYSQMHHSRLLGVAGSATPAPISSLWVCSWAL